MVAPLFHGYSAAIADALRRRGHEVLLWHYDDNSTLSLKLRQKLRVELPDRLIQGAGQSYAANVVTAAAIHGLRAAKPDIVLVIKGDLLGPDFWSEAAKMGVFRQLWLYDELHRSHHDLEVLTGVDAVMTYSHCDVARLEALGVAPIYVPNAFDATLAQVPAIPTPGVLFIGARYANRAALVDGLAQRGVPVRAVGRDWSHHPWDRLRTWSWKRPDVPALRDMPRAEAYARMAGADANLNSHFNQDGFTMRTFEIPGMGGLQFIDRADVTEFYDPGTEVVIYESLDELAELSRRALSEPGWGKTIGARARARTLAEHTFDHRMPVVEAPWA